MKKLILPMFAAFLLALYAYSPVQAGVGDIYYCEIEGGYSYRKSYKMFSQIEVESGKFKFKWVKEFGEDAIEFDKFLPISSSINQIKTMDIMDIRPREFNFGDTFFATKYERNTLNGTIFTFVFRLNKFMFSSHSDIINLGTRTLNGTCSKF